MTSALRDLTWPVRTERLALRPLETGDVDALWGYRSDPRINEWTGRSPRDVDELVVAFFSPAALENTLVIEHEGQVVGDLMVKVGDAWGQADVADRTAGVEAELGWTIAVAHQGRGLATEAVRAALEVCFDGLGVRRVTAGCFADNEPSWRLMERVGMRREGHGVQECLHRDLGWVDGYLYALLATEWRTRPPVVE